jgi:hypothetical protein
MMSSAPATSTSTSSNRKKRPAPSPEQVPADSLMPVRVQVSRDALMDSLPYVDATPEDYEEYAAALIEEEMKTFHPVMNHHHHHSVSTTMQQQPVMTLTFRTPLMEKEYQRLVDGDGDLNSHGEAQARARALTWLDSTHILTPPSKKDRWEEWKRAIQEAKVAYESERVRHMTLEVRSSALMERLEWNVGSRIDVLTKGVGRTEATGRTNQSTTQPRSTKGRKTIANSQHTIPNCLGTESTSRSGNRRFGTGSSSTFLIDVPD